MTSQTGQQIITIRIFPNISRSRGNQTMKFYLLIEYDLRNNFREKSCTKCDKTMVPDHFLKNKI